MTLVSTIIPVYNNERYLPEALASVLEQTDVPQEVWIIDDGSTDGTLALAQHLAAQSMRIPVTVIGQANGRAATARNTGVAHARGDFFAFLDSDDIWTAGRLGRMLDAFDADPSRDVVFGHVQQFISPELPEDVQRTFFCPPAPMPGLHPGGALIRRAGYMRGGGFNTTLLHGEIIDWVNCLREAGLHEHLLPDVVFRRRIHGRNNILQSSLQQDYLHIVRSALQRRRQHGQASS